MVKKDYYSKYKKYKNKYLQTKYDFYFYHSIFGDAAEKVLNILNSGYVEPNKNLPIKYRGMSGSHKSSYIFCNIYFQDSKNFEKVPIGTKGEILYPKTREVTVDAGIILHPQLFYEKDVTFNYMWKGDDIEDNPHKIKVLKNDSLEIKKEKLKEIKDWVEHLNNSNIFGINLPNFHKHEILLKGRIPIKYIIGIFLTNPTEEIKKKLNELNIKIYTDYSSFPKIF